MYRMYSSRGAYPFRTLAIGIEKVTLLLCGIILPKIYHTIVSDLRAKIYLLLLLGPFGVCFAV